MFRKFDIMDCIWSGVMRRCKEGQKGRAAGRVCARWRTALRWLARALLEAPEAWALARRGGGALRADAGCAAHHLLHGELHGAGVHGCGLILAAVPSAPRASAARCVRRCLCCPARRRCFAAGLGIPPRRGFAMLRPFAGPGEGCSHHAGCGGWLASQEQSSWDAVHFNC